MFVFDLILMLYEVEQKVMLTSKCFILSITKRLCLLKKSFFNENGIFKSIRYSKLYLINHNQRVVLKIFIMIRLHRVSIDLEKGPNKEVVKNFMI